MLLRAAMACLLLGATPAAAAEIAIGAVYPLATPPGIDARHAIETALDIVNGAHKPIPVLMGEGGGLDRLDHATLVVRLADDAGDPARARAEAERLVAEQHVVALVGGLDPASVAAISGVAELHGIPFLALDTTEGNRTGLVWFFHLGRVPVLDARTDLARLAALAAAADRKVETLAVVVTPGAADDAFRQAAKAAGLIVVTDAARPDATVLAGDDTAAAALLNRWPTPPVLLSLGAALRDPAAIAQIGPAANHAFRSTGFVAGPLPSRPALDPVGNAYEARAGKKLDANTARELTGILLLADVINRAGSTTPIDLRTALMATDTPGDATLMLWDGIRFDNTGQNVLATPALQQVQNGILQLVAPDAIATATPTWPKP